MKDKRTRVKMSSRRNKSFLYTCDIEYIGPKTEESVHRTLDLLGKYNVSATCFITARVLNDFPHLVREVAERGHEIASHGFSHALNGEREFRFLDMLAPEEVETEIEMSFKAFADKGYAVEGYRAPAFRTNDLARQCIQKRFRYSSSTIDFVLPVGRYKGGRKGIYSDNGFSSIPVTTLGSLKVPFGSPYLMFLGSSIQRVVNRYLSASNLAVFYSHCFDLVQNGSKSISALSSLRNLAYFDHCGSKRSFDFFHTLLSSVSDAGYQFTTCSRYCDGIVQGAAQSGADL